MRSRKVGFTKTRITGYAYKSLLKCLFLGARACLLLLLAALVCGVPAPAKDTVSEDGLTVSHDASNDPPFEWTLEKMLLAVPMPMTAEGRTFLSNHSNLDNVRDWDIARFDKYLDSDYAIEYVAEEAVRWRDLAYMLEGQIARGAKFLQKGPSGKSNLKVAGKPALFANADAASIAEIRKLLGKKAERASVLAQMKIWRQQIADMAPQVEALRKEASDKGLSDSLERRCHRSDLSERKSKMVRSDLACSERAGQVA